MNPYLKTIQDLLQQATHLSGPENQALLAAVTKADKQWQISDFKLERTEQLKKTITVLLEETIEELEQKRKAVEEAKEALERSLEELKATQAQLIQSEKMATLGELTAGIAHEIQNPLNFVNNFSEVSSELLDEMKQALATGKASEAISLAGDIRQNLEKVVHHGKRADAIVKAMLQHSRTPTGKKEATDLNALVEEYLRLSYHGMRARDKAFQAVMAASLDDSLQPIAVIPQDIGRVLLNLFNNAFYAVKEKKKIMGNGYEPTVWVSTKRIDDHIEVRVRDNGPGIAEEVKEKIFQPFFTTKPTGEGAGLGLSLSYDIITKGHGGKLLAETKKGAFAEFIVSLPIQTKLDGS